MIWGGVAVHGTAKALIAPIRFLRERVLPRGRDDNGSHFSTRDPRDPSVN